MQIDCNRLAYRVLVQEKVALDVFVAIEGLLRRQLLFFHCVGGDAHGGVSQVGQQFAERCIRVHVPTCPRTARYVNEVVVVTEIRTRRRCEANDLAAKEAWNDSVLDPSSQSTHKLH